MQHFNRIAYSSESHTFLQMHLITRWYVRGYAGRQICYCLLVAYLKYTLLDENRCVPQGSRLRLYATNKQHKHTQFYLFLTT